MYSEKYINLIKEICGLFPVKGNNMKKYCYVISNDSLLVIMNPKYVTGKVIESINECKVITVSNKNNKFREKVGNEYGFDSKTLKNVGVKNAIIAFIKSLIFIFSVKPNKLEKVKIEGILVGDLIYDSIIRTNANIYSVKNILNINAFKLIFKTYLMIKLGKRLFSRYKPYYIIAQDMVYLDAIYSRLGKKFGADIIMLTTGKPSYVIRSNEEERKLYFSVADYYALQEIVSNPDPNWKESADIMLEDLFKGNGDWNASNAYKNKIIESKESVLSKIGINNQKKNIVIMAHVFSDAPHCTEKMLYSDYYTWLVETLKLTRGKEDVNWILKPHPGRSFYKEDGVVEELFQEFKHDSLYWMPDQYSTLVLKEVADCIITVNGSAGYELSCLGIPVICTGKPFYSFFGYTINPRSIKEYNELLDSLGNINRLDAKKLERAKLVFYAYKKHLSIDDEFISQCGKIHNDFCTDGDVESANNKYILLLEQLINNGNFKESYNINYIRHLIKPF